MRQIYNEEMYATFNMGVGLLLFVNKSDVENIKSTLEAFGEEVLVIGEIVKGEAKVELC